MPGISKRAIQSKPEQVTSRKRSGPVACFTNCIAVFLYLALFSVIISLVLVEASQQLQTPTPSDSKHKLLVITVATDPHNEGLQRFNKSVNAFNLDLIVLGANQEWLGGDTKTGLGGGQKINLFQKALASFKNEDKTIILFVDSYDLIINAYSNEIVDKFRHKFSDAKIVFSAEANCWPNASLEALFPVPLLGGDRFLNSGAFIGFAPSLWSLFGEISENGSKAIRNDDDDQYILTQAYLNETLRTKLSIKLDHKSQLFQSLYDNEEHVKLQLADSITRLVNVAYSTEPAIIHGNGPSKLTLNSLGNYLGKAWTLAEGCRHCNGTRKVLQKPYKSIVLAALFITEPTPFLNDFFASVTRLDYPKDLMHVRIYNSVDYHSAAVDSFVSEAKLANEYASFKLVTNQELQLYAAELKDPAIRSKNYLTYQMLNETSSHESDSSKEAGIGSEFVDQLEWLARSLTMELCDEVQCEYLLSLDSTVRLQLAATISELMETNRPIVAPLVSRPQRLWSNFWGAVDEEGFYARSDDYIELVERRRLGVWNVPQVMNAYLIDARYISPQPASRREPRKAVAYSINPRHAFVDASVEALVKPAVVFSRYLRAIGASQFVTNEREFGHLVDPSRYNTSLAHPNLYELERNSLDWQRHYLHENYSQVLAASFALEQPCTDVFWFPLVSERFCDELVDVMQTFGQWSGGTNDDPRIDGGYENVPTRDIHLKQVGLHESWLLFLRLFVQPVQQKQYLGYEHDPPNADLAFVVRYNPAEQALLRPHHDASTYTLNIALNVPNADYDGGGCRFERYNCSVVDSRKGWALMHPGRLTHYHEGLAVTRGTRYILVTFIDP